MTLVFPEWGSFKSSEAGATTADSLAITLTGNGTHGKSASWTDLVASVPFDTTGILLMLGPTTVGPDGLLDVAIGAAGSESIIISNLLFSGPQGTQGQLCYFFPIRIPDGSRLSGKYQSAGNNGTIEVNTIMMCVGYPLGQSFSKVTSYGPNTTDSGAIGIDPGGTINTKPAAPYTEITSSTTNPIKQIMIVFGDRSNQASTSCSWLIDVAIGAASSEVDIFPNLRITTGTTGDQILPSVLGPFPCNIPTGTRLSARCQCSINDATDRLLDIAIYGIC